ncbi:unnamed protein product [Discosporangium mesarthrocarpum]
MASAVAYVIAGVTMSLSPDISSLIMARLLVGLASGISTVAVPIYIGEIAPPNLRGVLGAIVQFHLVFGLLMAVLLAFPLATEEGWSWLFGERRERENVW